jgi:hypothetical protein
MPRRFLPLLALRSEHRILTAKLATLEKQAKEARRPDLFCRRTEQLLVALERHLGAEQALACEEAGGR